MKCKYLSLLASAVLVALFFTASTANAQSFAVLGGPAVTLTGSTVNGNVGSLGAYTNTGSKVNGLVYQGDQVAIDAYAAFLGEYTALASIPADQCTGVLNPGYGVVTLTLPPGVYCSPAGVTFTGTTLILDGSSTDTWTFRIGTGGTGALTGTNFTVVGETSTGQTWQTCNNSVSWWVAEGATMTDSSFQGTILAGAAITVSDGTFNGNAFAKAAVTLTGTTIGCTPWNPPVPPITIQLGSIKVTGGGEIPVPGPNSTGRATFGFNAQPDKKGGAKGDFNYVNHVTGLHVNGTVDNIMVTDINLDNSPKTVQFSGTYEGGTFIVTVQDNGEPGTNDQFGIWVTTVAGSLSEVTPMRVISNGNIQFHK
jgi:hypothetical protein